MNAKAVTMHDPQGAQGSNPCVRNCCLDDNKICLGCGRSLPEILEWHHADTPRQQQILSAAQLRLSSHKQF